MPRKFDKFNKIWLNNARFLKKRGVFVKKLDVLKNKRNMLVAEAVALGLLAGAASYTAGNKMGDKTAKTVYENAVDTEEKQVKYYTEYTYIDHNASTDNKTVLVQSNTPLVAYQDGNWFEYVSEEDKPISFEEPKEEAKEVINNFSKALR